MSARSHFASQRRVPLKGSARKPFDVSRAREFVSHAADEEPVTVSVVLAPKTPIDPGVRLTREQFAERHCADDRAEEAVRSFAQEFGLTVNAPKERGRRTLQLTGSRESLEQAFGVTLQRHATDAGTFRLREGEITVPEELAPHVVAVLGPGQQAAGEVASSDRDSAGRKRELYACSGCAVLWFPGECQGGWTDDWAA